MISEHLRKKALHEEFIRREREFVAKLLNIKKNPPGIYEDPTPTYGDLMPIEEWFECVKNGSFIDYDGNGCPAKLECGILKMSRLRIYPSKFEWVASDATHMVWFNR